MATKVTEDGHYSFIKSPKKTVFLRTQFTKIGEIDTVKEYYTAELILEARWIDHNFDGKQNQLNMESIDLSQCWSPMLKIENGVGELKETIQRSLNWTGEGEGMMVERRVVKGSFIEVLELWNFPFDAQDLSVSVRSAYPSSEVELVEDKVNISCINKFVFMDEQEWELDTNVHSMKKALQLSDSKGDVVAHSSIDFYCKAVRRSGFFIWNTFFVLFFICCMTFTTFAVVYTKPENRLQLTFILLLTTVAFRSNVNSSLPKISYLTLMDKYIIYTMITQCTVCVWHAIVGGALHCFPPCEMTIEPFKTYWADKIVFIVLISFYFISVFVFFLYVSIWVNTKNKKSNKDQILEQ